MKLFLLVLFLVCVLFLGRCAEPVAFVQGSQINAAGFLETLRAVQGRVAVVNLWATWCEPCIPELHMLADLGEKLGPERVRIIALAVNRREDSQGLDLVFSSLPGEVLGFRTDESDPSEILGAIDPYWEGLVPFTYVLSPEGDVCARLAGSQSLRGFERAILNCEMLLW